MPWMPLGLGPETIQPDAGFSHGCVLSRPVLSTRHPDARSCAYLELGTACAKTGYSDPNTHIVPGVVASAQASGAALGTPPTSGGTGRILATSILGTALVVLMAGGAVLL